MAKLEFLNPVAGIKREKLQPAHRLDRLEGKAIGLYWNLKAGGDVALAAIAEELGARYPGLSFRNFSGVVSGASKLGNAQEVRKITSEVDAVIGTTAD